MDIITEGFLEALKKRGVKKITLKNYKSDIKNFIDWLKSELKTSGTHAANLKECIPFLKTDTISFYKLHLEEIQTPNSTTNRRLSTLRSLGNYLYDNGITNKNLSENLSNISKNDEKDEHELVLENYTNYLKTSKVSKNTIKNYIADVKNFLEWSKNQEFASE